MTAAELAIAMAPYMDDDSLVSPVKTFPGQKGASGNGLLYTAEYCILMRNLKGRYMDVFQDTVLRCETKWGFLVRSPGSDDISSYDDYIGVASVLPMVASSIVQFKGDRVSKDGRKFRLWLRQEVVAHCEFGCGMTPPILRRIYWCLCVLYSGLFSKRFDQDAWMLTWLLVYTQKDSYPCNKSWICRQTGKLWMKILKWRDHEHQKICARTLSDPDHPLGKHFIAEMR